MQLYKIKEELIALLSEMTAIATNEELTDDQKDEEIRIIMMKYNALEGIESEKVLNLTRAFKNAQSMSKLIDDEIKALTVRKKSHQTKADNIKKFLSYIVTPGEKFEDATAKIGWRKSETVWFDIENQSELPEEAIKITKTVNKTNLKKWIKENGDNEFCRIETNMNIQLK